MEMKNNKLMIASLLGGALLLTVGCEREKSVETGGVPGSPIVFSAATSYFNGDETRTVYSGDVIGTTNRIERIDWVPNVDKIQVNYKHGSSTETADFTITSKTTGSGNDAYKSYAGVSGNVLQWAEGSDHTFYAMYPTSDINTNASLTNSNHFAGTLYPTQNPLAEMKPVTVDSKTWQRYMPDMDYAYMVAYAGSSYGISGNNVILPFRPAVTTFEFRLRGLADEDAMKVTKAELKSNQALTGAFSFDITGGTERGATWGTVTHPEASVTNTVITVNFPGEGATLPVTDETNVNYLDFTVFALPVDLSHLTITLTFVGGKTRSLNLYDAKDASGNITEWHTFQGANKYVIINSSVPGVTEWTYEIEPIENIVYYGHMPVTDGDDYVVKSYKYNNHQPDVKIPVKWKLQYTTVADPADADWSEVPSTGLAATDFWMGKVNGIGGTTGENGEAEIRNESTSTTTGDVAAAALRAKLASATPRGTKENPFDLSKHPAYGNIDTETDRSTANCYTISAPGWYMFPCVYGNAILHDQDNKSAYAPVESDAAVVNDSNPNVTKLKDVDLYHNLNGYDYRRRYYTPYFYNVANFPITNPWIVTDLSNVGAVGGKNAIVVWQDTDEGDEIIAYEAGNVDVVTKEGKDFIRFYIDKDRIKPGNVMIALRGTVAGLFTLPDTILWSWQIWVTAENLDPNSHVIGTYKVMPVNLGWSDSHDGSVEKWADRFLRFRAIQYEEQDGSALPAGKGDKEAFTVEQIGDAITTHPSVGGNAYYQWGRKDPFLPAPPNGGRHPVSVNSELSGKFIYKTDGGIENVLIQTNTLDYSPGIRAPYTPFYNYDSGVGTTGWIAGPAYPWKKIYSPSSNPIVLDPPANTFVRLNTYSSGSYTFEQAIQANLGGLTTADSWIVPSDPEHGKWYIKPGDRYYHNYNLVATAAVQHLNPLPYFDGTMYTPQDYLVYDAGERSKAACPSNLWNSYVYDEMTVDPQNKFKTIYDPCPPGFTVPGKEVFIGNKFATNRDASHPTFCKYADNDYTFGGAGNLLVNEGDKKGLEYNGTFFPYTGGRIVRPEGMIPEGQGNCGYYWTDTPFATDWAQPEPSMHTDANEHFLMSFSFYHSAYAFIFGNDSERDHYVNDSWRVQSYTRGTAFSIRPMVDPKY